MISILYYMFIALMLVIAIYLWLQKTSILTLDVETSTRISNIFVPLFAGVALLTAWWLLDFGPESGWPVVGLILGSILMPIFGYVLVTKLFQNNEK